MGFHSMQKQIEKRLKSIRPILTSETDELQLINIEKNVVKIRVKDNREQGVNSEATLKKIIEIQLKQVFPEIKSVELAD